MEQTSCFGMTVWTCLNHGQAKDMGMRRRGISTEEKGPRARVCKNSVQNMITRIIYKKIDSGQAPKLLCHRFYALCISDHQWPSVSGCVRFEPRSAPKTVKSPERVRQLMSWGQLGLHGVPLELWRTRNITRITMHHGSFRSFTAASTASHRTEAYWSFSQFSPLWHGISISAISKRQHPTDHMDHIWAYLSISEHPRLWLRRCHWIR